MKLAAIDIGSNAARMLVSEVESGQEKEASFKKVMFVRVPLRLGFDVFETGKISGSKIHLLLETMKAFNHLKNAYQADHLITCATSAMREAANSAEILHKIKKETGLPIRIISGSMEATYLFENHLAEKPDKDQAYLYIDVGGGSTELSFYFRRKLYNESFKIGTIRLLKKQTSEEEWIKMKSFIQKIIPPKTPVTAVGTGGNINKLYSLSEKKTGKSLSIAVLRNYDKEMGSLSVSERRKIYDLKEDRADVIVPALQIYLRVMQWAGISRIHVPKTGLTDGLILHLYKEVLKDERTIT